MDTISGIRLKQPPHSLYHLLSSVIASIAIHWFVIALLVVHATSSSSQYDQSHRQANPIQLRLNRSTTTEGAQAAPFEKHAQLIPETSPQSTKSVPGINFTREPELISEIDTSIDDPYAYGFIILWLQISPEGKVEASQIIYSSLSEKNSKLLEERFGKATFSPKISRGQAEASEVLFKIDVD